MLAFTGLVIGMGVAIAIITALLWGALLLLEHIARIYLQHHGISPAPKTDTNPLPAISQAARFQRQRDAQSWQKHCPTFYRWYRKLK